MSARHDPELDDVLQDDELRRLAVLLSAASNPEPPLDDAFRSALRRQLMQHAWTMSEGRDTWWRRAFAPPGIAWAGAAAGLLLIASVVTYWQLQPPGGFTQVVVSSALDGKTVALAQPILVSFNQPMDHAATEAAVQITPATTVTYSWDQNQLAVQPTSGNLAPNTQYQVTIGPGAKTAAGVQLAAPQTITFVTQPPPPPAPAATPRPTPAATPSPSTERQLAQLGGTSAAVQWSADASTIYLVDAKGALSVVPAKGGEATVIAPDGSSSPAISPAGDRLAYIRGGKIEILTFAAGTTSEITPSTAPVVVGWAKDRVEWATTDAVYEQGGKNPVRLAVLSSTGTVTVLSIAPDGAHLAYQQDQGLFVLDLATGKSAPVGPGGSHFGGWSPSGAQLLYSTGTSNIVSDTLGNTISTLPGGEASWSSQDAILLGSETDLYQVHPDGTNLTKVGNGTYLAPQWAPNGSAFTFIRGQQLWTSTAPPLPPEPGVLDQASGVVNSFMQARLKGQADVASTFLDVGGKQAYASGGLNLVIAGEPAFTRYYILTQEVTGVEPDTARFVVRLVLTHGKRDVRDLEETLSLVRDATSKQFLVDKASVGTQRDLGRGAEVVGVTLASDSIQITFDSDLDPASVSSGIVILDAKGTKLDGATSYANRTLTVTGLDLKPGEQYHLVVLTTLRDVQLHNVAAEYDLDFVGPVIVRHSDIRTGGGAPATSPAAASPTPSPAG